MNIALSIPFAEYQQFFAWNGTSEYITTSVHTDPSAAEVFLNDVVSRGQEVSKRVAALDVDDDTMHWLASKMQDVAQGLEAVEQGTPAYQAVMLVQYTVSMLALERICDDLGG